MVPWRATGDGMVTEDVLEWYERFAEGQPGAIVVEATGIRDVPSGPLLRAGHDRFVPGLATLVERVRSASRGRTRLFLQLAVGQDRSGCTGCAALRRRAQAARGAVDRVARHEPDVVTLEARTMWRCA